MIAKIPPRKLTLTEEQETLITELVAAGLSPFGNHFDSISPKFANHFHLTVDEARQLLVQWLRKHAVK